MDISIIVKRNSRFNKSSFNNQLIQRMLRCFSRLQFSGQITKFISRIVAEVLCQRESSTSTRSISTKRNTRNTSSN